MPSSITENMHMGNVIKVNDMILLTGEKIVGCTY